MVFSKERRKKYMKQYMKDNLAKARRQSGKLEGAGRPERVKVDDSSDRVSRGSQGFQDRP